MILRYEGRCRVCGASFEYVFLNWPDESLPDELYVMCPFCSLVVVV